MYSMPVLRTNHISNDGPVGLYRVTDAVVLDGMTSLE